MLVRARRCGGEGPSSSARPRFGEDSSPARPRFGADSVTRPRFEAEVEADAVEADSSVLWAEERGALRIRRLSRPGICSQDREQGSEPYCDTIACHAAVRTSTSSPTTVSNDSSSSRYALPLRPPSPPRSSPLCSRRVRVRDLCALRRSFHDPRRRVLRLPGHWWVPTVKACIRAGFACSYIGGYRFIYC